MNARIIYNYRVRTERGMSKFIVMKISWFLTGVVVTWVYTIVKSHLHWEEKCPPKIHVHQNLRM